MKLPENWFGESLVCGHVTWKPEMRLNTKNIVDAATKYEL